MDWRRIVGQIAGPIATIWVAAMLISWMAGWTTLGNLLCWSLLGVAVLYGLIYWLLDRLLGRRERLEKERIKKEENRSDLSAYYPCFAET